MQNCELKKLLADIAFGRVTDGTQIRDAIKVAEERRGLLNEEYAALDNLIDEASRAFVLGAPSESAQQLMLSNESRTYAGFLDQYRAA